jgi:Fe-S-cluster containining protein
VSEIYGKSLAGTIKLEELKEKTGDCACERCVNACAHQPGWFGPGEAERAASFLEIPFDEFKEKFLVKDHCDNHAAEDAPYVYAPRKVGVDRPGFIRRAGSEQRIQGKCVFLENSRCSIHPVKPYECREAYACQLRYGLRDEVEKKWIEAGAPLGMRGDFKDEW